MLKGSTTANMESADDNIKCGEIHYQKGDWHYLCAFCGLISQTHKNFHKHLNSKHFTAFVYKQTPFLNKERSSVKGAKRKSAKIVQDDPLRWDPIEEEYASNISTGEAEETENVQDITLHVLDDPYLECDGNTNDCENSCHMEPGFIEKDEDEEDNLLEDSQADDESSFETETLLGKESQNESEIDWNTPFDPKYFKNREKRPYKPQQKPHTCTICGRTFLTRYQFDAHLNMHTGVKPYQCEICGRQFRAIATLKNHLITHNQRYFACSYCNKLFSRKPALLNHEKRHNQERNEACDLCGKRFTTVNRLDTHKRHIHKISNTELPFACNFCPKRYRTRSMLSIHRNKIHYKFQCEKCEKKFGDLRRLEEHRKMHVDEKILTRYLNVTKKN